MNINKTFRLMDAAYEFNEAEKEIFRKVREAMQSTVDKKESSVVHFCFYTATGKDKYKITISVD
jgi:hypothetical protein